MPNYHNKHVVFPRALIFKCSQLFQVKRVSISYKPAYLLKLSGIDFSAINTGA